MKNKKVAIIISPNWHDYAKNYLEDFIKSARALVFDGEIKFFITDNETSEESFKFLQEMAEEVKIVRNKNNDGFSKGCNDSMREAMKEDFDYFINLSIHSELDTHCVEEMVKVADSDPKIGAVQARCMLNPEKDKVLTLGGVTHFLGFGYCNGYKEAFKEQLGVKDIAYPSGGSFLLKRETIEKVGMFDEELWMYSEDQELGWRIWLAGQRCVLAPKAVMYSKYSFLRSTKKYYWMERNRVLAILFCYHWMTLVLIMPALIVMEFGLVLFSLKTGWFKKKIEIWKYFLSPRTWKYILKARKRNQSLRKVRDRDIIKLISGKIWYQEVDDWKLRVINPVFNFYWKLVKKLIVW